MRLQRASRDHSRFLTAVEMTAWEKPAVLIANELPSLDQLIPQHLP